MKKLLVYCTQLLATGGIESHVLKFCQCMSQSGVEIVLLVPNYQVSEEVDRQLKASCKRVIHSRGMSTATQSIWLITQLARMCLYSFDALYTNGQGNSILIVSKCLFRKSRWVHHHHTSGDNEDQATWSNSYVQSLRRANLTIACSPRNAFEISLSLAKTIDTIPCFSRDVGTCDQQTREHHSAIRFGYFGRLIKEKGISTLCELSMEPELQGIEFHFWGKQEQFDKEYFHQFPNVFYNGSFQSELELRSVVNYIDAFLLISTHPEGLPICLLEAMSAGLPWIATDRGGTRDITVDNDTTILLPASPDRYAVKTAILKMAKQVRSKEINHNAQRSLYLTRFSEKVITKRWHQALFRNEIEFDGSRILNSSDVGGA